MKKKYFIYLIFMLCGFMAQSQNLSFKELFLLPEKPLGEFQEFLYENDFLLYRSKKEELTKTDSILFINKEKVIIGLVSSKKDKVVFLENISEVSFKSYSEQLKQKDFVLVKTEIQSDNSMVKKYINLSNEIIIEVRISMNMIENKVVRNDYRITLIKEGFFKRKYKKFIGQ